MVKYTKGAIAVETKVLGFEEFITDVEPQYQNEISALHHELLKQNCKTKYEEAKSGFVVSYIDAKSKKVLFNYVFRKKGLLARIYGNNIDKYTDLLQTLPPEMRKEIAVAPDCKRLIDPESCSSKCAMGYSFTMDGVDYKKCRFNSFMHEVTAETFPYIKSFVENELCARLETTPTPAVAR